MFENEFAEGTGSLKLYESALFNEFALQVSEKDLHDYIEATRGFWGEMPESAFSTIRSVLKELNKPARKKG